MRIDGSGKVGIGTDTPGQVLDVAGDTDVSAAIGRAHVGYDGVSSDVAIFAHADHVSNTNRALWQDANGVTALNAASGQNLRFRINNADVMRIDQNGNVGIGTTTPLGNVHIYAGDGGGATPSSSACQLVIEDNANAGLTIQTGTGNSGNIFFDDDGAGAGRINYEHSTDDMNFYTGAAGGGGRRLEINSASGHITIDPDKAVNPILFIHETTNTFMTIGLTINQAANDDEILAAKSSDVAHGMTTNLETDTFGSLGKADASAGGLKVTGARDADGNNGQALYLQGFLGEAADTTKSTSGRGVIELDSYVKSGTSVTAVGADGNLVVFGTAGTKRFIFDAEGSGHADVEWTTFSDERLKSNIRDLPSGIDTLMKLKPRIFDRQSGFISDGINQHLDEIDKEMNYTDGEVVLEDKKRVQIGLIAQEAVDIIPEIVHNPPDKYSFYSMDYERLSVYNLAGIQDLKNEIDSQQQQIEALQAAVSALQAA